MKVALTGGIGAGKSTVCRMLAEKGAMVVSTDAIVHDLLASDANIIAQVRTLLDLPSSKEKLERSEIAKRVFGSPEKLQALEQILHPAVREKVALLDKDREKVLVVEIPLLFEGDSPKEYDATIAVVAPDVLCEQRYQKRHPERDDFALRAGRQLSQEEKAARADYVIVNEGSEVELQEKVTQLWNALDKGKSNRL